MAKVIQESPCRVLQVTFKWKTLKQLRLKTVEFCPAPDIKIDITLALFQEKLQNHAALKKYGKFVFILAAPFYKKRLLTFGIFNESNIWAKVYHI